MKDDKKRWQGKINYRMGKYKKGFNTFICCIYFSRSTATGSTTRVESSEESSDDDQSVVITHPTSIGRTALILWK